MKKVIAVCGPTAVGKTRMGVSLAEALHGYWNSESDS